MSTFNVHLEIANPLERHFEEIEALVDTGSTYSAAPRELLERLGIRSLGRERFRLATGEVSENEVGEALVRIDGRERTTPVIFNESGEPMLLGAVTLEAFLLGVDPVARRLVPVEGLRMSRSTDSSSLRSAGVNSFLIGPLLYSDQKRISGYSLTSRDPVTCSLSPLAGRSAAR